MAKIDAAAATERLLRFLAVPGITGEEGRIARPCRTLRACSL
jgi:hypothetical protein